MKLTKITFTGVDENTNPLKWVTLTREYPFIEWGFLFSKDKQGNHPRYPSESSIESFKSFIQSSKVEHNLSAHICGTYTRQLINGEAAILDNKLLKGFKRVQINFSTYLPLQDPSKFVKRLAKFNRYEFILQVKDLNDPIIKICQDEKVRCAPLLDLSGGTGKVLTDFPAPNGNWVGYAGGLNPDNVARAIRKIEKLEGLERYWIDMESGVRTDDWLDLDKCEKVIEETIKERRK
jgi:phosphoribosylanthranilate isomerase